MLSWFLRLASILILGLGLVACGIPGTYQGVHLYPAQDVPTITGLDHEAQPFNSDDLKGQVVIVFFGYVFCPDYCPLIMNEIAEAYDRHLVRQQDDIEVLFVTLDPDRDSPAQLGLYTTAFHPDFTGIYIADTDVLATLSTGYGVFTAVTGPAAADGAPYLVDHTTRTYVLNRTGQLELAFGADIKAQVLARDLRRLLKQRP